MSQPESEKPAAAQPAAEPSAAPATPPPPPENGGAIAKTAAQKAAERTAANLAATAEAEQALATLSEVGDSELMPFAPKTFEDAWKLAHHLSNSNVVADGFKGNAGAVLSIMATGTRIGIFWAIAVQIAAHVKGRVSWPAQALAALVENMPDFEYFEVVEADNERATVEAKKRHWKEPRRYTVTLGDAKDMGFLDGKHSQLWTSKRPMPMLIAMARREAARLWAPGRTLGLFTPDEIDIEGLRNVTSPAPAGMTTSSLERFAETSAPAALPAAAEAVEEEQEEDMPRYRLNPQHVTQIEALCSQPPVVQVRDLEGRLGATLNDLEGRPGEGPAGLYTRVLRVVQELKANGKR